MKDVVFCVEVSAFFPAVVLGASGSLLSCENAEPPIITKPVLHSEDDSVSPEMTSCTSDRFATEVEIPDSDQKHHNVDVVQLEHLGNDASALDEESKSTMDSVSSV